MTTQARTQPHTDINGLADLTGSAEWQWSRSTSKSSGWTDIDKATGSTYTPDEDGGDSGYYLRATAKYRTNRVLVAPITTRRHPWYRPTRCWRCGPPTRSLSSPNLVDPGEDTYGMRTVAETATAGQLVGDPVTAEDGDADDVLTYTLEDASDKFVIDRATGQISVAKSAKFNRHVADENTVDGVTAADSYTVTVIATDPKGIPTDDAAADIRNEEVVQRHRRCDDHRHCCGRTADIHRWHCCCRVRDVRRNDWRYTHRTCCR